MANFSSFIIANRYLKYSFVPGGGPYLQTLPPEDRQKVQSHQPDPTTIREKVLDYFLNSQKYLCAKHAQILCIAYQGVWALNNFMKGRNVRPIIAKAFIRLFPPITTITNIANIAGYGFPGFLAIRDGMNELKDKKYVDAFCDVILYGALQVASAPLMAWQLLPRSPASVAKTVNIFNAAIMSPYLIKGYSGVCNRDRISLSTDLFRKGATPDQLEKLVKQDLAICTSEIETQRVINKWEWLIGPAVFEKISYKILSHQALDRTDLSSAQNYLRPRSHAEWLKLGAGAVSFVALGLQGKGKMGLCYAANFIANLASLYVMQSPYRLVPYQGERSTKPIDELTRKVIAAAAPATEQPAQNCIVRFFSKLFSR